MSNWFRLPPKIARVSLPKKPKRMCPASWNTRFTLWIMPVKTDQPSIRVVFGKKTICNKNKRVRNINAGFVTGFQGWIKEGNKSRIFLPRFFSLNSIRFSLFGGSVLFCTNWSRWVWYLVKITPHCTQHSESGCSCWHLGQIVISVLRKRNREELGYAVTIHLQF